MSDYTPLIVPALLNGQQVELTISRAAAESLAEQLTRVKAPLVGYDALHAALKEAGVKIGKSTLYALVKSRKIPCFRFGGRTTFQLADVLKRIGGR